MRANAGDQSTTTVAGVFGDPTRAEQALERLRFIGVDPSQISVIAKDHERARDVAEETGAEVATGATAGTGLGAMLGGVGGLLVGLGALAIPGIGPVIAAGPLAAVLGTAGATAAVGAGVGAAAGGLVGALTGWGIAESEAQEYQARVEQGEILLVARVPEHLSERAQEVLRESGGARVSGKMAA